MAASPSLALRGFLRGRLSRQDWRNIFPAASILRTVNVVVAAGRTLPGEGQAGAATAGGQGT